MPWEILGLTPVALLFLACGGPGGQVAVADGATSEASWWPTFEIGPVTHDAGERRPCEPLAPQTPPITVDFVFFAGRDSAGTLFVLNFAQNEVSGPQLLVSEGGILVRQRIANQNYARPNTYDYVVVDHQPPFVLQIEQSAQPWRAGIHYGILTNPTFVIGEQGEELTILRDPADINSILAMPAQNLTISVDVGYAATLPDGRTLLIILPHEEVTLAKYRVFLGDASGMAECRVRSVLRDAGDVISIWFDLDDDRMLVTYQGAVPDGGFAAPDGAASTGGGTLTTPRGTIPLAGGAPIPAQASYGCW